MAGLDFIKISSPSVVDEVTDTGKSNYKTKKWTGAASANPEAKTKCDQAGASFFECNKGVWPKWAEQTTFYDKSGDLQ